MLSYGNPTLRITRSLLFFAKGLAASWAPHTCSERPARYDCQGATLLQTEILSE